MNRKVFFLLCIFILSRLAFINPLPVFFDSPEYLTRFSNPNYLQAISSGHLPFHVGYVLLFWPVFHLANFFNINPPSAIIFTQIIFSAIAVYAFYGFARIITDKKTAFISASIAAILPLYWIMNVTIMAESTYINSFIISLFFITLSLKKEIKIYEILGFLFFAIAILTNPLVALWIPFLISIVYFFKKRKIIVFSLSLFLTIVFAFSINSLLISYALHTSFQNGIHQYLFGTDIKTIPDISSFLAILRFIRNLFIPLFQNNTFLIIVLSAISLVKMFRKKKLFIMLLLWILPMIITNQWYDSLLFGRHGEIAVFGLAFLTGIFLEKKKILFIITVIYVLVFSLPAMLLLKQPIPYLETGEYVKTLPKGLLIENHFARPQVEGNYSGTILFVNQPGWNPNAFEETVDNFLNKNQPVFVTSFALSDPYGAYFGPFLYSLSLSYANKFELQNIIPQYTLQQFAVIDENAGLLIYKIISKEKSSYPNIPKLAYNRHRIDYFDPLTQLWFLIKRANVIQSQSMIKG